MALANQTPESHLLATAAAATTNALAAESTAETRAMLADIGIGLTRAQALAAPKIFQLNHRIGEREVVKLLVLILRAFVDSLRVKDKPDAGDLIALADDLSRTYTHDSIKDIILALKEARTGGHNFFQALDVSTLYKLIADYFDKKAHFLENRHLDQKASGASTQAADVKLMGDAAPRMLENVAQQIPDDHPNAEALRQKLTITNQKARRGLITPQEAEQQRAEVRKAIDRKPRKNWQASPEAQRLLDKRHRAENAHLMEKYRP